MYSVDEVVLLEWQGWLKAFRVVEVIESEDRCGRYFDEVHQHCHEVEYKLEMVDVDNPGWIRPGS